MLLFFFLHSLVLSTIYVVHKYVAEVVDAQISFTTTIAIQRSSKFKGDCYNAMLLLNAMKLCSLVSCLTIPLLLCDVEQGQVDGSTPWIHLIFLMYPCATNFFESQIQIKKLETKIKESQAFFVDIAEYV
mmetsp:Transcript_5550/g.9497  ORF Transcript_5550/g.9497 Transcript_5550/m.9497 type:complete len:130 (+) Transcript_5550:1580-1969(+)